MNTTKFRKGFTLIELVVTIVLLGALAAIASVSYSAFLSDARGEIAAVESAQDDRIAAAQALLDEEGEFQAPALVTISLAGFSFGAEVETVGSQSATWSASTPVLVLTSYNTYAFLSTDSFEGAGAFGPTKNGCADGWGIVSATQYDANPTGASGAAVVSVLRDCA
jgi:prepilin-type N-terminal cleavage/methylation domain-containing protein